MLIRLGFVAAIGVTVAGLMTAQAGTPAPSSVTQTVTKSQYFNSGSSGGFSYVVPNSFFNAVYQPLASGTLISVDFVFAGNVTATFSSNGSTNQFGYVQGGGSFLVNDISIGGGGGNAQSAITTGSASLSGSLAALTTTILAANWNGGPANNLPGSGLLTINWGNPNLSNDVVAATSVSMAGSSMEGLVSFTETLTYNCSGGCVLATSSVQSVPEPAAMAILGTGIVGLGLLLARRRA